MLADMEHAVAWNGMLTVGLHRRGLAAFFAFVAGEVRVGETTPNARRRTPRPFWRPSGARI